MASGSSIFVFVVKERKIFELRTTAALMAGEINLTRPRSGRAKFSSSRRVGRMVGHSRAGRADGRVGVSSSGAGRADGGAQPGGSGGWRVKVSSSRLASRMANWMANWMANYIPPSTDGGPRAPCLECGGWFKQSTEHERAYEHEHEHEHEHTGEYISGLAIRTTSRHPDGELDGDLHPDIHGW